MVAPKPYEESQLTYERSGNIEYLDVDLGGGMVVKLKRVDGGEWIVSGSKAPPEMYNTSKPVPKWPRDEEVLERLPERYKKPGGESPMKPFDVNRKESAQLFWQREGRLFTLNKEEYFEWVNDKWQPISETDFKSIIHSRKVNYDLQNRVPLFVHQPTSGVQLFSDIPDGTFLVGSFDADLQYIINEAGYPEINHINFSFPLPLGEKFNLLNVGFDEYTYWTNKGGFFTKVNGRWVDAAVEGKHKIIVVSDVSKYLYKFDLANPQLTNELTGFGKEIHRLEWVHGYRYDPNLKEMVANGVEKQLPALTQAHDYIQK